MFVLINGSFGIGKTTVAGLLESSIRGGTTYDPEQIGSALMRMPAWSLGPRRQPDDFQDLRLWQALIGPLARHAHRRSSVVIVPMAFTNRAYFDAFVAAMERRAPVHRLCLVAPLSVVEARLVGRGAVAGTRGGDWAFRRARECAEAHKDAAFGQPIDATQSPNEIAATIRQLVGI